MAVSEDWTVGCEKRDGETIDGVIFKGEHKQGVALNYEVACEIVSKIQHTEALEAEVARLRELCEKARKYVTGYAAGSERNLDWFVYRKALKKEGDGRE